MSEIRHGGLIALPTPQRWAGVLILGPSGSGKSDLALRCLDAGFHLVADDQVELWSSGGAIYGKSPTVLSGLIEVRGQGILQTSYHRFSRVDLACRLTSEPVERMPDPAAESLLGHGLAQLLLNPWDVSAPLRLRQALMALGTGSHKA